MYFAIFHTMEPYLYKDFDILKCDIYENVAQYVWNFYRDDMEKITGRHIHERIDIEVWKVDKAKNAHFVDLIPIYEEIIQDCILSKKENEKEEKLREVKMEILEAIEQGKFEEVKELQPKYIKLKEEYEEFCK